MYGRGVSDVNGFCSVVVKSDHVYVSNKNDSVPFFPTYIFATQTNPLLIVFDNIPEIFTLFNLFQTLTFICLA